MDERKLKSIAIVAAVTAAAVVYKLLASTHLNQTAALFVGIPALLAILVSLVSPQSAVGVAIKSLTYAILASALFLQEGVLCIVLASPILYLVAIAIGKAIGESPSGPDRFNLRSVLVLLVISPMALEGVTPWTTLNRDETVAASRIVAAPADAVARALFEQPRFERVPPRLLKIGFPSPIHTRIEPAASPPRWTVTMRGGEMYLNGMEPRTGDLALDLVEHTSGTLRWRAMSDSSHLTHFLNWRESTVVWEAVDAHSTRVTWTLRYRRGLDPAWYFGPMERYFMTLAARYLIETVAAP